MEEEAKIILYKQLMKIELLEKVKNYKIMDWEEFVSLKDAELLKYVVEYRDNVLKKVYDKKHIIDDKDKKNFYLELPKMNLEGEDLSDLYLHTFTAGYSKERNNGKKIFITTNINLKNTNCIINMGTIHPIIVSEDGVNIKEISADITKCDFRGCTVFGKFQNTKAKLIYTEENLPKEYIERLENFKVPENAELTTDYMYIDMLERKIVKGMNGLDKVKQIVDYDLTSMKRDIWKYRDVIKEYNIDISYTGAFIDEYGFGSIGKENYYIDLEIRAKEAYKAGDLEYVNKVYNELDKETRKKLLGLALRDGQMEFVKKHKSDLSSLQKKYINIQNEGIKIIEEENKVKELLRKEYKEGKMVDFGVDIMKSSVQIRSEIIEEIYKLEDLKVVEKYLNEIDVKIKNNILTREYKNGNRDFILKNFSKIDNNDMKKEIIAEELENKNMDFLFENFHSIDDENLKNKLFEYVLKNEESRFIKKYFDEFPKNMQIEAIIKIKDLGILEEKMLEFLKK